MRSDIFDVLARSSEMAGRVRAHDWAATPLGPIAGWSDELRAAVYNLLASGFPAALVWGPGLVTIYNDGFRPILGNKPEALGRSFADIWSEAWHAIGPIAERAFAGETTYIEDFPLVINRSGEPEQAYFTFSYSPVRAVDGTVLGMIDTVIETTERKRAEERLRESEARVRALTDNLPAGMVYQIATGADGTERRFLYVSQSHEKLTGVPANAVLADPTIPYNLLLPEDRARVAEAEAEAMRNRTPFDIEVRFQRADGELRWCRILSAPREQADGSIIWDGIQIDTTEQKASEAALRESEARFRMMADAVPAIVWVTDAEGRNEFFNRQWFEYTGSEPTPTSAQKVTDDHLHPDDAERTIAAFDEARRAGTAYLVEHRIRSKSGDYRWFIVRGEPYHDPETGEIIRWFGASVDIHDRRQAEAELHESEARLATERAVLATLVEHLPVGVIVVDRDGNPLLSNPAYARLIPEAVIPSRLPNPEERWIGHDERGQRIERNMFPGTRALRGELVRGAEFLHRAPDGQETWTRISAMPLRDSTGSIAGALCVIVDIDAHKRVEAALRQLNDTLEQRVVERTAELSQAHEQLRQSQKLEAMGQLTGGVAHDFNNLLSPIVGSLDLLQRKGLGGERERRLIDGALQSAERARVLVQRLLAFARRQPLQPKPVDVGALVSGMADLVASTSGPQIKVVVDVADKLPAAVVDPNQVEMAILNLAVNARDAMPAGGTLRISAERETVSAKHRAQLQPGCYVRLSVADTGTGMDAATLKKAVEPFFSTKGVGRGTGLGLSMVHGLALQLGGGLTIDSKPGLGTNVEIWLPASAARAGEIPVVDDIAPPSSAAGTALLVDDEELVRMSTADMLADLGYTVIEAGSAEEALRLIDGGQDIDLLVTDHLMPGMTGTELAREVRGRRPDARVLVVSGYAEFDGVAPDLPRLVKPFRQADLAAKLSELDEASTG